MVDDDKSATPRSSDGHRSVLSGRPPKFWVILGLVVIGFLLVLQNSGDAEVHVLWFVIRMPLAFLLLAMVLVGVALDRAWLWRQQKR